MAVARFIADKSVYARLHQPAVFDRFWPLTERGLVATCTLVDLEILYSARSKAEYDEVLAERAGFERLDIGQQDWDRAVVVQQQLAAQSKIRAVAIPDLLIAAVAERHRVGLLHYDRDFEHVAKITGQPVEWIVPAGTVA